MHTEAKDQHEHDAQGVRCLDEDECWEFLAHHWLGRVALVRLGMPSVFPVTYVLDGRSIVFRTAPGTKLARAAVGASTAFEVDEASKLLETGTSVVVQGNLREVHDHAERLRLSALPLRTWAPGERDHFLRVEPLSVTGRSLRPIRLADGLGADGG